MLYSISLEIHVNFQFVKSAIVIISILLYLFKVTLFSQYLLANLSECYIFTAQVVKIQTKSTLRLQNFWMTPNHIHLIFILIQS